MWERSALPLKGFSPGDYFSRSSAQLICAYEGIELYFRHGKTWNE
jgi:hypothetical protein